MLTHSRPHPRALLSLPEAARELAVSEASVRRWIKSGSLPAFRVGPAGRFRIERADLDVLREPAEPGR